MFRRHSSYLLELFLREMLPQFSFFSLNQINLMSWCCLSHLWYSKIHVRLGGRWIVISLISSAMNWVKMLICIKQTAHVSISYWIIRAEVTKPKPWMFLNYFSCNTGLFKIFFHGKLKYLGYMYWIQYFTAALQQYFFAVILCRSVLMIKLMRNSLFHLIGF